VAHPPPPLTRAGSRTGLFSRTGRGPRRHSLESCPHRCSQGLNMVRLATEDHEESPARHAEAACWLGRLAICYATHRDAVGRHHCAARAGRSWRRRKQGCSERGGSNWGAPELTRCLRAASGEPKAEGSPPPSLARRRLATKQRRRRLSAFRRSLSRWLASRPPFNRSHAGRDGRAVGEHLVPPPPPSSYCLTPWRLLPRCVRW